MAQRVAPMKTKTIVSLGIIVATAYGLHMWMRTQQRGSRRPRAIVDPIDGDTGPAGYAAVTIPRFLEGSDIFNSYGISGISFPQINFGGGNVDGYQQYPIAV